jgi:cell division septum initiation protein DivIVA
MDDRRFPAPRPSGLDVPRANFAVVRKGFDQNEVRAHLEGLAREYANLEHRLKDLSEQLADAKRRAANPVFEESQLVAALGNQSAAILRAAHDEAGRVTSEAQERATLIFRQAQERGTQSIVEAQERALAIVSEAETAAAEIDASSRAAALRLEESARLNGEALVESARDQGRAVIEQAQEARKAILNDLAVKRKALTLQIDQLRAARESISSSVTAVRGSIDAILDGLMSSDEAARAAAIEALRGQRPTPEPSESELVAGVPLREVPEPQLLRPEDLPQPNVTPRSVKPALRVVTPDTAGPAAGEGAALSDAELLTDDRPAADVVEEIFARLRSATKEEKAADPKPARKPAAKATPATPIEHVFARRDEAVAPSLATLVRKIKRALQDDQNVVMERLRGVSGMITTELGDEHDQRSRYVQEAREVLRDAALAGVQFAAEESGCSGTLTSTDEIDDCANDLALTIVLALRKRILADGNGDGADRANAAFKEWRGARVERLCGDAARRAFHVGVLAAAAGRPVRFVAAPNDAPCDACSLDAAAGERQAGSPFPSGSAFPPLHAGCGCAVVPVSTP